MPYNSTGNPPSLTSQGFGGKPFRVFAYKSSDLVGTVAASSYFSNGHSLGMRVGDVVEVTVVSTASPPVYLGHNVGRVTAVSTGAGATVAFASSST